MLHNTAQNRSDDRHDFSGVAFWSGKDAIWKYIQLLTNDARFTKLVITSAFWHCYSGAVLKVYVPISSDCLASVCPCWSLCRLLQCDFRFDLFFCFSFPVIF